ncbi:DUF2513 domain-containing protein [Plesiomonas shigelloides]|uniref:DUF2513 domain-containing protein n=1 Tax=Plesiomonas shigelloides TaxID=703 RepID=UPI000A112C95|nr:DUF2513 domain-containing protein [Plesiomonas shigelloides]
MKIDLSYLSSIMDVFLDAKTSHITITDFQTNGIRIESENHPSHLDEKFLFHLQLALENNLISNQKLSSSDLDSIGVKMGVNGHVILTGTPIRLTQQGHDFATALANKEVLMRIKEELKDAPFKVILDGSQKLLEHIMKKKIDALLG